MKTVTTTSQLLHSTTESNSHLFDDWFDPIETGIRDRVRGLIEEMIRGELDTALSRPRYGRLAEHAEGSGVSAVVTGHRHGSRVRTLTGTFGKTEIAVPRPLVIFSAHPLRRFERVGVATPTSKPTARVRRSDVQFSPCSLKSCRPRPGSHGAWAAVDFPRSAQRIEDATAAVHRWACRECGGFGGGVARGGVGAAAGVAGDRDIDWAAR